MIITNAVALLCSGGAALLRPVYQLKSNQMQYSIPDWQKKLFSYPEQSLWELPGWRS